MGAKLTTLTYEIAIQLHIVTESCTICSSRSRRPVRKLLVTPSYMLLNIHRAVEIYLPDRDIPWRFIADVKKNPALGLYPEPFPSSLHFRSTFDFWV